MKRLFTILAFTYAFTLLTNTFNPIITKVYCDTTSEADDSTTQVTPSASLGDLADNANEALESAKDSVTKVANNSAMVMIIICFVGIIFFRNRQKVAGLLGAIGSIILAFLGIQIVSRGWLTKIAVEVVNKYF